MNTLKNINLIVAIAERLRFCGSLVSEGSALASSSELRVSISELINSCCSGLENVVTDLQNEALKELERNV